MDMVIKHINSITINQPEYQLDDDCKVTVFVIKDVGAIYSKEDIYV